MVLQLFVSYELDCQVPTAANNKFEQFIKTINDADLAFGSKQLRNFQIKTNLN